MEQQEEFKMKNNMIGLLLILATFVGCESIQVKHYDTDKFQECNAQLAHLFAQDEYNEQVSFKGIDYTSLCQLFRPRSFRNYSNDCPGGVCPTVNPRIENIVRPQYYFPPVVQPVLPEYIESPIEKEINDAKTTTDEVSDSSVDNDNNSIGSVNSNSSSVPQTRLSYGSNGSQIARSYGSSGTAMGYSFYSTNAYPENIVVTQTIDANGNVVISEAYNDSRTYSTRQRGDLVYGQPIRNIFRRLLFWR